MSKLITQIKRFALALCLATPFVSWAVTTTGYEDFGDTAGVVLWRGTEANFHASTVIDVAEDGTLGTPYAMTADNSATSWQRFSRGQTAYASPGKVLVYDTPGTDQGYKYNPDSTFNPISFGGMWVKTLAINGLPFSILGNNAGKRDTEFGASDKSTLFKFDASFTIDRTSPTTFFGEATVDIAQDATFTAQTNSSYHVVVDSAATLKLKGAGTLAVTTMDVNGTLDLSATTRPTIVGNVALEGTIVLPAGTEVSQEAPFTVCSGTLSGVNVLVKIGDAEAVEKSFTAENGAITSFGEPIYEFTENFPTIVPSGKIYTFIGGATAEAAVTVPNTVSVSGTLKTSGFITVPYYAETLDATLDVVDGTTTLVCTGKALAANLTVEAGATLVNGNTDAVDYDDEFTANIYGTLAMGDTRWSLGSDNTINLYEGCTVTGTGSNSGYSAFDWIENATATLNVYGDVSLAAPIRLRSGATVNVNVDTNDQKGLTLVGTVGVGTIVKKGAGLIKFTTNPSYPITVENGAFTFAVDATPTITYSAKPGTGTTMSMWYATQATWKGTVVLNAIDAPNTLPLESYGNANSKIVLKGTSGSTYLNSNATIDAEVVIDGAVEFNNGSSGNTYTFKKVSCTNSDATLTLKFWSGCSSLVWVIDELNEFSGTIVLPNESQHSSAGDKHKFTINNVVKAGATAGTKLFKFSQPTPLTSGNYNAITVAKVNGAAAKLAVASDGVYVAVASTTIGGVTAYYNNVITAFDAVSAGSAGDTLTILDGSIELGPVTGFSYDSNTKTYTKLQMVAQFTYGVTPYQYPTIADACTDAEMLPTVPTVELLVELGEQTVPSGWQYNNAATSGTTYGTLTFTGYVITSSTVLGEDGSFTIPENTKVIKLGGRDVTAGFRIDGTTATLLAPEVEEGATKKAIDIGADNVTLNVALVPGLYYGVASGTGLTLSRPTTLTQYTGDDSFLTVDKPSAATGFFKVFVDIKEK